MHLHFPEDFGLDSSLFVWVLSCSYITFMAFGGHSYLEWLTFIFLIKLCSCRALLKGPLLLFSLKVLGFELTAFQSEANVLTNELPESSCSSTVVEAETRQPNLANKHAYENTHDPFVCPAGFQSLQLASFLKETTKYSSYCSYLCLGCICSIWIMCSYYDL